MSIDRIEPPDFLTGLDFPASTEDIVRRAQEVGAETRVLAALRSLPIQQFGSVHELREALGGRL